MKIGRYEIKGLLGRGGMGAVYKAAMPVTGRIVALKVLKPADILEDLVGMDRLTTMFLKEARTMASISHANIASILDVHEGQDTTAPHFAMEYFCGNLGVIMGEHYEVEKPSRRLGVEASLHIANQMLSGLDRLHFEGIIHRDVKPFNVMLAEEEGGTGHVKLIDFGLSKLRGETTRGPKGMVVGSPYYTAPEQEADPEAADTRSDIFSVGVTLYRMLTGELPTEDPIHRRPINELHPDLGADWDALFARALAPNPADRFSDALDMIDALGTLKSLWIEQTASVCSAPGILDAPPIHSSDWNPRTKPLKVSAKSACATFGLDELWRPTRYAKGTFSRKGPTIHDASTGLVWETEASRYPLSWDRAHGYIDRLNRKALDNRTNWRLPTLDELMTLFTGRTEPGDFCQQSIFDPRKARLWSGDMKAFTAAWYVDAELGFVWWQDRTCRFFVRGVCEEKSESSRRV
ncbi:protein kinase domain-containing protein [Pseudodesulfovibrio piezophilus]|uniref:Serine/threonine protein kinase n=1 Tax=Pseudodesulfovibrio piezophilus (strain DSM 21447 / JCM 15486 / C1TLV30) TaxID=1322246 RepID=M1WKH7_PSEP2|nr:protein kinase [Pseudodesulfovibrio piezophilus]CCH49621.1 Serine/threonine protein kinase [Pseudodesulfovibrio piezophilus C1TLV30]